MTEEERDRLQEAKAKISERLRRVDVPSLRLDGADPRLSVYLNSVCSDPAGHCLWEQLAAERFIRFRTNYTLSEKWVKRFVCFYERLTFPGPSGPASFPLTPVQTFQFASVYGLRRSDGSRLTKECCLFVPRKFSKTTSSAAFVLWDLLYGAANGESYIGANSQDQARKCFDVVRYALRKLDNRGKRYRINKELITPTIRNTRQAIAQCLTANARTKDGLNASTIVMDEYSQARDSTLMEVLTTSMGVRKDPLTVIITTASDVFDGPFYALLQGYKGILLGDYVDDRVFAHLFEPDPGDPWDSTATWRKVHPHLGVTVSEEFYREEMEGAKRNGSEALLAFMTKLLNVYTVNESKSWISAKQILEHSEHIDLARFAGEQLFATIGIDLSVRRDFSAVTLGMYSDERKHFYYKTWYFFPRGALPHHPNERLYRKWAEDGHLILQEGEVIDYNGIVEHILSLKDYARIVLIGYDPYKSLECVNMLRSSELAGAVKAFPQGIANFTSAVQSFEACLFRDRITIDDNPINAYCFGNAVLMTGFNDNVKPEKRVDSQRIDGVITTLMAHKLFGEAVRVVI